MVKVSYETEKKKKLKILACPANKGGCAYYRVIMPAEKLQELYPDRVEVRFNYNPLDWDETTRQPKQEPNLSDIEWADVVFTQNIHQFGGPYTYSFMRYVKEQGKFLHYDTDDLLTNLYPEHKLFQVYIDQKLSELTQHLYNMADLVSVTQNKFAHRISQYCTGTLAVIKNAIDFNLDCWNAPKTEAKVTRIGWAGGIHHRVDVQQFRGVIAGVNRTVGTKKNHWIFMGRPPKTPDGSRNWEQEVWDEYERNFLTGAKHPNVTWVHALPPNMYGFLYKDLDIAIAPLQMNDFNDSKSEIKLMECGRYGVPLVCTNVGCYEEVIKNYETGYLIPEENDKKEWVRVLSKLSKEKQLVKEMGQNLKKVVDERYDINKHIHLRIDLYERLLEEKQIAATS